MCSCYEYGLLAVTTGLKAPTDKPIDMPSLDDPVSTLTPLRFLPRQ